MRWQSPESKKKYLAPICRWTTRGPRLRSLKQCKLELRGHSRFRRECHLHG